MRRTNFILIGALASASAFTNTASAQKADTASIRPGTNLVVEGIPAIPASLAAEVRRYTESRSAGLADWHPTRREMLISTRFGNTPQLHRVAMPLGAREQLTFFEEPVGTAKYEPTAGRYFLFVRDIGGNEFSQIYRYDVADGRVALLTDGRSRNGDIEFSNRGDRIAYTSTRRNGSDGDIYVMNPLDSASGRLVLEVTGGNGWSVLGWSRDDRKLLVAQYLSVNQSFLYLVDVATGQRQSLTPQSSDTVAYGAARFSRDGLGVYFTSDQGSEFQRLAYMNLKTMGVTALTGTINWDVDEFELSEDGRTIAFVTNEAGSSRLYLLDTQSQQARAVTGLPAGVISGLVWRKAGRELGFDIASAKSPSDVYSVNADTRRVTRWTASELGGLVESALVEPTLVTWPSFDARPITGYYYRPAARFTGKRPVIINIHGGPEGQSRPGFLGRSNYFINELGVAIIYPNVRGSTGYGKSFVKLDNGVRREDSVKDIAALLDWIAKQPELDAERVMITGGSYGGYMTLATATNYNDRICCALDIVGISNFNTFLTNTESYRRDLRRAEYGDERNASMHEFFEKTAPLNNAGKITKPLFVVAGGNDPRVPRTEAEQMVARVKQNGSPVWYLMARDEGHGFRKKSNVDFQFYSTVMFIRQNLLGGSAQ